MDDSKLWGDITSCFGNFTLISLCVYKVKSGWDTVQKDEERGTVVHSRRESMKAQLSLFLEDVNYAKVHKVHESFSFSPFSPPLLPFHFLGAVISQH